MDLLKEGKETFVAAGLTDNPADMVGRKFKLEFEENVAEVITGNSAGKRQHLVFGTIDGMEIVPVGIRLISDAIKPLSPGTTTELVFSPTKQEWHLLVFKYFASYKEFVEEKKRDPQLYIGAFKAKVEILE